MVANTNPISAVRRVARMFGLARERDDLGRPRRGTWMMTWSGVRFWPLDPLADEVEYDDICIGTARECRYGNHCREFYSVAEHEVIVSLYAERFARERGWSEDDVLLAAREGLIHDSGEAYIGDMIRPIKHQPVMRGFRRAEKLIQRQVFIRFGVEPTSASSALVKEIDNRVLVDEIEALMLHPDMYLERHASVPGLGAEIAAMPWQQAAAAYSQRFAELWPEWTS
jgi:hypothetical protein